MGEREPEAKKDKVLIAHKFPIAPQVPDSTLVYWTVKQMPRTRDELHLYFKRGNNPYLWDWSEAKVDRAITKMLKEYEGEIHTTYKKQRLSSRTVRPVEYFFHDLALGPLLAGRYDSQYGKIPVPREVVVAILEKQKSRVLPPPLQPGILTPELILTSRRAKPFRLKLDTKRRVGLADFWRYLNSTEKELVGRIEDVVKEERRIATYRKDVAGAVDELEGDELSLVDGSSLKEAVMKVFDNDMVDEEGSPVQWSDLLWPRDEVDERGIPWSAEEFLSFEGKEDPISLAGVVVGRGKECLLKMKEMTERLNSEVMNSDDRFELYEARNDLNVRREGVLDDLQRLLNLAEVRTRRR